MKSKFNKKWDYNGVAIIQRNNYSFFKANQDYIPVIIEVYPNGSIFFSGTYPDACKFNNESFTCILKIIDFIKEEIYNI